MFVEEEPFIDHFIINTKEWDPGKLKTIFSNDLVERVRSIPIPKGEVHDQVNWYGHSLHRFSVKETSMKWVHRDVGD